MQIPTSFSAAQAISIASQTSSRDKAVGDATAATTDSAAVQSQLEKSQSASPDRDAQGQGDGLGPRGERPKDENDIGTTESEETPLPKSTVNGEPDNQLDLLC
jgi:hypothetical protein